MTHSGFSAEGFRHLADALKTNQVRSHLAVDAATLTRSSSPLIIVADDTVFWP